MSVHLTYKALADPTRRRILELLREQDLTAGEIATHFNVAWPSISHHLNLLKDADLVLAERQGQFIRYSLNTTTVQDIVQHLLELVPASGREQEGPAHDSSS